MKITAISDLHGYCPKLPGGDLLIVAGDLTGTDHGWMHEDMRNWMEKQDYEKVIVIAGNHDGFLVKNPDFYSKGKITYLCDAATEYQGYLIYGSPWTPEYCGWHFMLPRGKPLIDKWDLIPVDVDILITHGPPMGILDWGIDEVKCGCRDLGNRVEELKPYLHVFGHIHEQYGRDTTTIPGVEFVNCAIMNEYYNPVNKPVEIEF